MIDNDMGSPKTFDSARLRGKENNAPQEQDLFTFSAKLDKTTRIVFAKGFLTFDQIYLGAKSSVENDAEEKRSVAEGSS